MTQPETETLLQSLSLRLSQLDGIGLARPTDATVAKLQAGIDGFRETLTQVTLTLEAHLNDIEASLAEARALLQAHLTNGS